MKTPVLAMASAIVLSSLATAQTTVVSPKVFQKTDGPGQRIIPFYGHLRATYRWRDLMEIHDLDTSYKGKLSGIKWRREGTRTSRIYRSPSPVFWADMEVHVSTAAVTSKMMTTTWSINHGKNLVNTVKRKKVNFKTIPYIPKVPAQPFLISIPFDSGKQLAHAGGSVALQVLVHDNDLYDAKNKVNRNLYKDFSYNATAGFTTSGGRGCYSSDQNTIYPFVGNGYADYDSVKDQFRYSAVSSYGLFGGVGVNLMVGKLLPNSIALPGGCWLHADLSSVILATPGSGMRNNRSNNYYYPPYITTSSRPRPKRQYVRFPSSASASIAGAQIYSQSIGVDPKANSMGLTLTNWSRARFPLYQKKGLGVSSGHGYKALSKKRYFRSIGYGHVTSFTFQ